jgi:hypothetical protein
VSLVAQWILSSQVFWTDKTGSGREPYRLFRAFVSLSLRRDADRPFAKQDGTPLQSRSAFARAAAQSKPRRPAEAQTPRRQRRAIVIETRRGLLHYRITDMQESHVYAIAISNRAKRRRVDRCRHTPRQPQQAFDRGSGRASRPADAGTDRHGGPARRPTRPPAPTSLPPPRPRPPSGAPRNRGFAQTRASAHCPPAPARPRRQRRARAPSRAGVA